MNKGISTPINASLVVLSLWLMVAAASAAAAPLTEKDLVTQAPGPGLYELAYDASQNTLFAASAPSFEKEKTTGVVFTLDPVTLAKKGAITTSRRAFATALDEENHTLYIGNTLEGSVTLIDTRSGKEMKTIQLSESTDPKHSVHTREMVLDKKNQRLYVSGVAEKGIIWVVDTRQQQHIATLGNMGAWPTGLAVDADNHRLYAVNGWGELIATDTNTHKLVSRVRVEPGVKHFFLNLALDTKNGRAFITDPDLPNVLVVDLARGKILHRIDVINALAVAYNPTRDEIYITHRNARRISIVDATRYAVKSSINTQALPNSLALSPDGQALYVSVKQGEKEMGKKADYVIKVDLTKI